MFKLVLISWETIRVLFFKVSQVQFECVCKMDSCIVKLVQGEGILTK